MYIDFKKCQRLATELLANQHLSLTKINVMNLQYDKNILFFSIQDYAQSTNTPLSDYFIKDKLVDGCTIKKDDLYIVLYNKDICPSRINWTLGHEIGHIYLRHIEDTDKEEIEAHFFAAQLLMPECVLFNINETYRKLSVSDITNLFFVSKDAAEKRLSTFVKKTYYSCTESDNKIWSMLKDDVCRFYNIKPQINHCGPFIFASNDNDIYLSEQEWLYGFL